MVSVHFHLHVAICSYIPFFVMFRDIKWEAELILRLQKYHGRKFYNIYKIYNMAEL